MPPSRLQVGTKTTEGHNQAGNTLHPYEVQRLRQVMRNNARLQQLGIPGLCDTLPKAYSFHHNKNKPNFTNNEDSESDYNPSSNDTGEEDLLDDDNVQGSKDYNMRTTNMSNGVIKLRTKRLLAEKESIRITRSKKTAAQPNGTEVFDNNDGHTQATVQASDPALFDEYTHMANGGHSIARPDGHNLMGNKDNVNIQVDDNMTSGGEASIEPSVHVQLGENDRWERGVNMGHGLHRMNRAMRGKLPVVIPEGRIRPVAPLVAAKFSTECNIAVRNHVPVYKHWKDYKNHNGMFNLFTDKLSAKFDINTNDAPVQKACSQMMKNAIRQQRYRLKKKFFDPFPLHLVTKTSPIRSMSNEEWNDLVEYWKSPKGWRHHKRTKIIDSKLNFIKQRDLVAIWFM